MADAASTNLTVAEIENELREVTAADWFQLGIHLEIKPAKLREIERDHPRDVQRCKTEVLDWWHRNAPEVTWDALADALEKKGGYGPLAQRLRRKMPPKENQVTAMKSLSNSSATESSIETTSRQNLETRSKKEGLYSLVKKGLYKELPDHGSDEEELLYAQSRDIQSEFNSLFTKVVRKLVSQGVNPREFIRFLKREPGSLFEVESSKLQEVANDLVAIIEIVEDYCSWFNHSLLGQIIKIFCEGDKKIQKAHKEYYAHLQKYCKHRVRNCRHKNTFTCGRENGAKMLVKVDEMWEYIEIKHLQEVLYNIARILKVQRYLLDLSSVEEGCVQLTLLVPICIADAVFPLTAEQEADMMEIGVTDLRCRSYHFPHKEVKVDSFKEGTQYQNGEFEASSQPVQVPSENPPSGGYHHTDEWVWVAVAGSSQLESSEKSGENVNGKHSEIQEVEVSLQAGGEKVNVKHSEIQDVEVSLQALQESSSQQVLDSRVQAAETSAQNLEIQLKPTQVAYHEAQQSLQDLEADKRALQESVVTAEQNLTIADQSVQEAESQMRYPQQSLEHYKTQAEILKWSADLQIQHDGTQETHPSLQASQAQKRALQEVNAAEQILNITISDQSVQNADHKIRYLQPTVDEYSTQTENSQQSVYYQTKLQAAKEAFQESQAEKRALQERVVTAERNLAIADQNAQKAQYQIRHLQQHLDEANARTENLQQSLEEANIRNENLQQSFNEANARAEALQQRMYDAERRAEEAERRAHNARVGASEDEPSWVVQRDEINLTDVELGRGGWAIVRVAEFRGVKVAAKCLYSQILSDYNQRLFIREINMAARVHHPNLLQFIGATLRGELIILTELMPTSVRKELEYGRTFSDNQINSISLDVARALNYLHLMQPSPIIHRDISSANILLEPRPSSVWRAKVSDYGSVNLLERLRTSAPGNPTYAAPEAGNAALQSPKMDIFSFGVLLVEMYSARFPEMADREYLISSIQHPRIVALIQQCLTEDKNARPSASDIIAELSE